jgi:hypothetical protein
MIKAPKFSYSKQTYGWRSAHEFGGSKMQRTSGFSLAPKQTCHRLSRDGRRAFPEFTNNVVPSSVVISSPLDSTRTRATGWQSPSWQQSMGYQLMVLPSAL